MVLSHVNSQPVSSPSKAVSIKPTTKLSPLSTLPFCVHQLHFLREITLPQEQTRVLWVPARAARKHLIEIELEVEGYPFFLFLFTAFALLLPTPYYATRKITYLHTLPTYKSTFNNSLATVLNTTTYSLLALCLSTYVCLQQYINKEFSLSLSLSLSLQKQPFMAVTAPWEINHER